MKNNLKGVLILFMVFLLAGCGKAKINWSEIELGSKMPEPTILNGKISTDRSDLASIHIDKITKNEYKNYVQECIKYGYTADLEYENWDLVYGAFNEEGYSIRIVYLEKEKEMSITLKAPEQLNMKEIEWPTTGLGAMLPTPKSNLAKISWNNSETFIVHIGNMMIDDYNQYVKEAEASGFTNDYSKTDKYYSATNSKGYKLNLRYLGGNVIEVSLSAPEGNSSESSNTNDDDSTIDSDFKEAMDNYEKFMDEYIAFMKKYKNSSGTDMELLKDYSNYLQRYAEMGTSFEKWKNEELNSSETKYYLEVQKRVSQKLIDASLE